MAVIAVRAHQPGLNRGHVRLGGFEAEGVDDGLAVDGYLQCSVGESFVDAGMDAWLVEDIQYLLAGDVYDGCYGGVFVEDVHFNLPAIRLGTGVAGNRKMLPDGADAKYLGALARRVVEDAGIR